MQRRVRPKTELVAVEDTFVPGRHLVWIRNGRKVKPGMISAFHSLIEGIHRIEEQPIWGLRCGDWLEVQIQNAYWWKLGAGLFGSGRDGNDGEKTQKNSAHMVLLVEGEA